MDTPLLHDCRWYTESLRATRQNVSLDHRCLAYSLDPHIISMLERSKIGGPNHGR